MRWMSWSFCCETRWMTYSCSLVVRNWLLMNAFYSSCLACIDSVSALNRFRLLARPWTYCSKAYFLSSYYFTIRSRSSFIYLNIYWSLPYSPYFSFYVFLDKFYNYLCSLFVSSLYLFNSVMMRFCSRAISYILFSFYLMFNFNAVLSFS